MSVLYFLQRESDRALFELGSGFGEVYSDGLLALASPCAPGAAVGVWFALTPDVDVVAAALAAADDSLRGYSDRVVAARLIRFAGSRRVAVLSDCSSDEAIDLGLAHGAPGVVGSRYLSDPNFAGPDGAPLDPLYMREKIHDTKIDLTSLSVLAVRATSKSWVRSPDDSTSIRLEDGSGGYADRVYFRSPSDADYAAALHWSGRVLIDVARLAKLAELAREERRSFGDATYARGPHLVCEPEFKEAVRKLDELVEGFERHMREELTKLKL